MFELLNKLRLSKQLTFEEGEITLLGEPAVMIIPGAGFMEMQKKLMEKDPLALYDVGENTGNQLYDLVHHYAADPKHMIKFGIQLLNLSGYGKFQVMDYKPKNKRAIVHVDHSINVRMHPKDKKPVCHYIRGLLAGFMENLYKANVACVETHCMAIGDKNCEFVIQKKNQFDPTSDLVKEQLRLE